VLLALFGVAGCELRGPAAGVWTSGGDSGGAGMEVPSVREKLTGSNDSGLNRLGIVAQYRRTCRGSGGGIKIRQQWTRKRAYAMAPPLDKPKRSARTGKRTNVSMKTRGEGKEDVEGGSVAGQHRWERRCSVDGWGFVDAVCQGEVSTFLFLPTTNPKEVYLPLFCSPAWLHGCSYLRIGDASLNCRKKKQ